MRPETVERFWSRVGRADVGCWPWLGVPNARTGYGEVRLEGVRSGAHRVAYELAVGPIPEGLQLDHLCRNRDCCNPDHLEPVTIGENLRRGLSFTGENSRKTECHKGHPFDDENTYITPKGKRMCRACNREAQRRYAARRPAMPLASEQMAGVPA